jgi:ribosomal protein S12 methylthiotransferase accessory factor
MAMDVSFPGGMKVAAKYKNHTLITDQPRQSGGLDEAPSPFDLFIISIGTCAGFYALNFCKVRNITTDGMRMSLETDFDPGQKLISNIRIHLTLPEGFPDEYRLPIIRAIESCTVKKHLNNPPAFDVTASV